jgi:hypothetical protein
MKAKNVHIQNLHDATLAPLSILRYSRWRPRWLPVQTNTQNSWATIIQHRAMILVSTQDVFRVKEFIEMVNLVVEGLIDNKIQDGHRLKGKQQNSFIIHTIEIIVVSNAMLSGLRNSI